MLVLDGDKVQTLAKLVYYQEVKRIKKNPYKSEYERGYDLRRSRETYLNALSLTKLATYEGTDLNQEQEKAGTTFKQYLEYAVGYAYACVENIKLRDEYISGVKNLAQDLKNSILGLADSDLGLEKAQELFNTLEGFKRATYQAIVNKADKSYRVLSRLSRPPRLTFSKTYAMVRRKFVMERAVMFNKQADRVILPLDDNREMIESMLDTMAKENKELGKFLRSLKWAGKAVLVLTVVMLVVDAGMAEGGIMNKVEVFAKGATNLGLGFVIGGLFESATVWAAEFILGAALIGATPLLALGVGLLAIGVGFAVAYFAAPYVSTAVDHVFHWLHNLAEKIFGSEDHGKNVHNHLMKKISVSDIHLYVAPPPDGLKLAFRLAHKGGD